MSVLSSRARLRRLRSEAADPFRVDQAAMVVSVTVEQPQALVLQRQDGEDACPPARLLPTIGRSRRDCAPG